MDKKYYSVRRYWTVCDTVVVQADDENEASELAFEEPLSDSPDYIEDSMTNDPAVDTVEYTVIDGEKKA